MLVNSEAILDTVIFKCNIAYQTAGSISILYENQDVPYVPNIDESNDKQDDEVVYAHLRAIIIVNCIFEQSHSAEFGGAIASIKCSDLYLDSDTFTNCTSGSAAGAIILDNSLTFCLNCTFAFNESGRKQFTSGGDYVFNQRHLDTEWPARRSLLSGGGAILAVTRDDYGEEVSDIPVQHVELCTQNCCFVQNMVFHSAIREPVYVATDIMFAGDTHFRSYFDSFTAQQDTAYLHSPINGSEQFVVALYNSTFEVKTCNAIAIPSSLRSTTSPITVSEEGTDTEIVLFETDEVLATDFPTIPMTKLPFKTTSSMTNPRTTLSFQIQTRSKIQSVTASASQTPTCSTGGGKTTVLTTPTDSKTHYEFPFIFSPSQSSAPSATTSWDTWPCQSSSYRGTPTASTGTNFAVLLTMTESRYGEVPHPLLTHLPTFENEPSMSSSFTATQPGYSWPRQTYTEPLHNPTRSHIGELPGVTVLPTASWYGEIPNPTITPSISFFAEAPYPSQTSDETLSNTPTQTDSAATYSKSWVLTHSVTLTHFSTIVPSYLGYIESVTVVSSRSLTSEGRPMHVGSATQTILDVITYVPSLTHGEYFVPSLTIADIIIVISPHDDEPMPNTVIIGISLGSAFIVCIILGVIWYLLKTAKVDSSSPVSGESIDILQPRDHTTEVQTLGLTDCGIDDELYNNDDDDAWL